MQHDNMKLHAKLRKFHMKHAQNGATVQHIHTIQDISTICPKQQLGILQASKLYATAPQHNNKRHGHYVQVKHYKTWTLRYLQKPLEHAQKDMSKLQIITVHRLGIKSLSMTEMTSGCNFRAIKHVTGSYHGKIEHDMLALKTKNKTPLLN